MSSTNPASVPTFDRSAELAGATGTNLTFEPRVRCEAVNLDTAWALCEKGAWPRGYFYGGSVDGVIESSALSFQGGYLELGVKLAPPLRIPEFVSRGAERSAPHSYVMIENLLKAQVSPDLYMQGDKVLRRGAQGPEIICEIPRDVIGLHDPDLYSLEFFPQETKIAGKEEFQKQLQLAMKILEVVIEVRQLQVGTNIVHRALFGPPIGIGSAALSKGGSNALAEDSEEKESLRSQILVPPGEIVKLDDIKGQPVLVEELRLVSDQVKRPEVYAEWGAESPAGIMLYGPPGTGKTMSAKGVANELGLPFLSVTAGQLASKWLGDLEKFTRYVFEIAREEAAKSPHKRAVLFLDEVDALIPKRDDMTHEAVRKQMQEILTALDGFKSDGSVFVIAATNRPDLVDGAFRSRMSKELEIGLPNLEGRADILQSMLEKKTARAGRQIVGQCDIAEIAHRMEGFSGRDIKNVVNSVTLAKARRASKEGSANVPLIETSDFDAALAAFKQDSRESIPFGFAAFSKQAEVPVQPRGPVIQLGRVLRTAA